MKNFNAAILKQGSFVAAGLLLLPSTASACGGCAFSIFEYKAPHIILLCYGISVWFFAVMIATAGVQELRLSPQLSRHFIKIILYFLLSFIIASAYLGPLPFAVLCLIALYTTLKAYFPTVRCKMSPFSRISLTAISVAAFFCLLAWVVVSMQAKNSRRDAEFVLQWNNTYKGRVILQQLIAANDTSQLRWIFNETKDKYLTDEITEALAKVDRRDSPDTP